MPPSPSGFLFLLLPGLLGRRYNQLILAQRYAAARRLARLISCLHPSAVWRTQPEIVHGLELAQRGDIAGAEQIFTRLQDATTQRGLAATMLLFRLRDQWREAVEWQVANAAALSRHPLVLPHMLRARGEAGDLRGLIEMYDGNRQVIAKLAPVSSREYCRLMLFAFCGKPRAVGRMFQGRSRRPARPPSRSTGWPPPNWPRVTATRQAPLEPLLSDPDPNSPPGSRRRLAALSSPPVVVDPATEQLIQTVAQEQ